jgi:PHS family inorganic phosphate transporter-like MFS transporter
MTKTDQELETPPAQQAKKVHWSKLEEVEKEGRPPFLLTKSEIKLLGIAGVRLPVSFFLIIGAHCTPGWVLP